MIKKLFFILTALSACTPKTEMVNFNVSLEQNRIDFAECEYEATAATQSVDPYYGTSFGADLDRAIRRNQLKKLCLKARGYSGAR